MAIMDPRVRRLERGLSAPTAAIGPHDIDDAVPTGHPETGETFVAQGLLNQGGSLATSAALPTSDARPEVWFAYTQPGSFSGQSGAMELIIEGLAARGWSCRQLLFPALNRAISSRLVRAALYIAESLTASLRLVGITLRRRVVLHLSPGQSLPSLLKVAPIVLAISWLRPRLPRVISLHGSVFARWRRDQLEARLFRFLLKRTAIVTVLSARQHRQLAALGVDPDRIVVLPNTCELPPCSDADLERKGWTASERSPLRLLHLSLLIESKGYPEYLEALDLLGQRDAGPIEAVLCGPLSFSAYCRRFTTPAVKDAWIRRKMEAINASRSVRVRWVPGAKGAVKHALLSEAAVFIFPSRFPVEAQPLVLLEAMASGCAIVTSTAGEICSTLDQTSAVFLSAPSGGTVAAAVEDLMAHPGRAAELARNARDRYASDFGRQSYTSRWADLFSSLSANHEASA